MPSNPQKSMIPPAELRRIAREIPKRLGGDYALSWEAEETRAAFVILAIYPVGVEPKAISRYTGVPLRAVERYCRRLADNGILVDGVLKVGWHPLVDEMGLTYDRQLKLFWGDVLTATGKVKRVNQR